MSNFKKTAQWLAACGKQQNDEIALSVQIACHIEEFCEFLTTLQVGLPDASKAPEGMQEAAKHIEDMVRGMAVEAHKLLTILSDGVKNNSDVVRLGIAPKHREDALDALCDMEVTGNGVAYLAGFNKEAADEAVIASNYAKLVDGKPVIKPGGKIGKPDGWSAPSLKEFV